MKNVFTGKTKAKGYIVGGLAMMAMGVIMFIFMQPPYGHSIGLLGGAIVTSLVLIGIGLFSYARERDRPVFDERSMRIFAQSGNITWFLSWILLGALASLAAIGVLHVSFELIVWTVWITMPWIFLVLRFVLGRRGEVV